MKNMISKTASIQKKGKQYINELDSGWKNAYLSAMKSNNPELFQMGEEAVKRYLPFYEMYSDFLDEQ